MASRLVTLCVSAVASGAAAVTTGAETGVTAPLSPVVLADVTGGAPLAFLHIPKTGGTAIEDLAFHHGKRWGRYIHYPLLPADSRVCSNWHLPRAFMKQQLGEDIYRSAQTFCVVRHPYSRAISQHIYQSEYDSSLPQDEKGCNADALNRHVQRILGHGVAESMGSKRSSDSVWGIGAEDCHWLPQWMYTTALDGKPNACNHILTYNSTLDAQLSNLFDSYGLHAMAHDPQIDHRSEPEGIAGGCQLQVEALDSRSRRLLDMAYARDFSLAAFGRPKEAEWVADAEHTSQRGRSTGDRRRAAATGSDGA